MKLERALQFSKTLMEKTVQEGDVVIDCTVGNGYDTKFLAKLVGPTGRVIGFDVQQAAINNTIERLEKHQLLNRVQLHKCGHENLLTVIEQTDKSLVGKVAGAIFNLGYLPGSDKTIVTKAETTIAAIEQLLTVLARQAIIVLVVYHGHEEGIKERDQLLTYAKQLDQTVAHVLKYEFINQKNMPPFIIAIEKL